MASEDDILVDIPMEDWLPLSDKYRQRLPYDLTGMSAIHSQFVNKTKFPDFPVSVTAPRGNPDDGVVIIWTVASGASDVCVFCLQDDHSKLVEALFKTRRLVWSERLAFRCVMADLFPSVLDIFKTLDQAIHCNELNIAHISREKAMIFDTTVPTDVRLQASIPEHAAIMDKEWPHHYPGSLQYFEHMVGWGACLSLVGAQAGDLRGWVLTSVRGDMHAVQVLEEHRRKGYAQLLLKTMGRQLAEAGRELWSCIVTENSASKEMFLKIGYEFLFVATSIHN